MFLLHLPFFIFGYKMERLKSIYEKFYKQFPFTGNIVIVDTETTGFAKDARVIEIGAIAICYDGFDITFDTFETLINPGFNLDAKIVEITGITDSELEMHRATKCILVLRLGLIKLNRIR
jgi:DNA polymerase III alpha subunit (gram-positive type)